MKTEIENPYNVPPFDVKINKSIKFFWWSWHPNYPFWSKSCWGGSTIEEAIKARKIPTGGDWLSLYHNKLIRENENGTFTEVLDSPCELLEIWQRIYNQRKQAKNPNGFEKIS